MLILRHRLSAFLTPVVCRLMVMDKSSGIIRNIIVCTSNLQPMRINFLFLLMYKRCYPAFLVRLNVRRNLKLVRRLVTCRMKLK
jgi:hypothetical protein